MTSATEHMRRLHGIRPTIEKILASTGTAGASVGVVHRDETWTDHFGFRDHERKHVPNDDTLYTIGSLTKGMLAQAIGSLVKEGGVTWDTTIKSLVPEFSTADRTITEQSTIADALCHRTGLPTFNVLWHQGGSYSLIEKDDLIPMINAMEPAIPFRSGWQYTNWTFALLGVLIERVTASPWSALLKSRLWEPLGMKRTTATAAEFRQDSNAAEGFSALPDLSCFPVRSTEIDDQSIMGAAGGVNSTIADLLRYYGGLTKELFDQAVCSNTERSSSPFQEIKAIFAGHNVLYPPAFGLLSENTYGYGWIKTKLPASLGLMSDNPGIVSHMPILAEGMRPQTVFYHQGMLSGFTSCVVLMPEIETCIVTLVNTRGIGDSADWIAQLLLETVLDTPYKHDFVALAEEAVQGQSSRYQDAKQTLSEGLAVGTSPGPLEAYCGRYYWTCDRYFIDIDKDENGLKLVIKGREDQHYPLVHHEYDDFIWLMTDEEEQRRGRFIQAPQAYRFSFTRIGSTVKSFTWNEMGGGKGTFKRSIK